MLIVTALLGSKNKVVRACVGSQVPDEGDVRKMMTGKATKLESQFRLTYSMILNLLRVEDLKVCTVLRCAVLRCAALCCAVLCCAVLRCAELDPAMIYFADPYECHSNVTIAPDST